MKELCYTAGGRALRALYLDAGAAGKPLIVDIHGGGFCFGKADDDVRLCERLAGETGYNAVTLDYRLAPAHRYPAAGEDCLDTLEAVCGDESLHFDREKIFVIGHSAGANLAVWLLRRMKKAAGAVLDYPWLNIADNRRKYIRASIPKFILDGFAKRYCRDKAMRKDDGLSPVYMSQEALESLPPMLLITGGCDSLRSDGAVFFQKLKEAGCDVRHTEYPQARHGFIEMASDGRVKKNFYTNAKTVCEQYACYEKAVEEIKNFMDGLNEGDRT